MTNDLSAYTAGARQLRRLADHTGPAEPLAPASAQLTEQLPAPPGRVVGLAAGTWTVAAAGRADR